MKKYRKKLIREKTVIAIYQKLLIDITEEEIYNYLDSDKELANDKDDYDYCAMFINSIINNLEKYKEEVAKHLKKGWSIDRLSKMELAILLVGCYELLETDQRKEVVINEAVELSKKYCDDDVYKFVNGILNKIK
ncbi:MAG: transcription antitermination factor NusB [[Clostridium] spiroforme]|uniref:Transcription antitermination factor NusB n=1 Tax=Thomasclavelia spiroformis TaxID=29348 RepID=A0A943ELM9_9FIRM|nr:MULTISPECIES: transcription antitermination factor NusB [Thomasclavelia]MBS5587208.1 transcription antitermination factor NusB [Thomasclavelia spiroformis]